MADSDFPSDFERDARRQERSVDEHRRRQELETEVERLPSPEALARRLLDGIQAAVERRTAELEAEVAALRADRAALLASWVDYGFGLWWIQGEAIPRYVYPTREAAEAAVLAWAHSRKRGTP